MTRETLKQMIIDYFLSNPSTSTKPLFIKGDAMGAGVRGQIAGMVCVLRDNKTLIETGGTMRDVFLTVDKTKLVQDEVNEKWEDS